MQPTANLNFRDNQFCGVLPDTAPSSTVNGMGSSSFQCDIPEWCTSCNRCDEVRGECACDTREVWSKEQNSCVCAPGWFFDGTSCGCPPGLFFDDDDSTCLPCPDFCETCDTERLCTDCQVGYHLDEVDRKQLCVADGLILPTSSTEWAVYKQGCIVWDTEAMSSDTMGSIVMYFGEDLTEDGSYIIIAENFDLSVGSFEWTVHGLHPAPVKLVISSVTGETLFVSKDFAVVGLDGAPDHLCDK